MKNTFLLMCAGIALEVAFTAACAFREKRDWTLSGHTTLWMFPIYALVYPALAFLWPRIGGWPWAARGLLYLALLYAVEYASGWLIRKATGRCPWDYGRARWAVHGLIRLDFAPGWLCAVFLFERLYLFLRV